NIINRFQPRDRVAMCVSLLGSTDSGANPRDAAAASAMDDRVSLSVRMRLRPRPTSPAAINPKDVGIPLRPSWQGGSSVPGAGFTGVIGGKGGPVRASGMALEGGTPGRATTG